MILDILPLAGGTARLVRVYGGEPCVKLPGAVPAPEGEGQWPITELGDYCFSEKPRGLPGPEKICRYERAEDGKLCLTRAFGRDVSGKERYSFDFAAPAAPAQDDELHPICGNFLEEVTLPDSLRVIGSCTFYNCRRLRRLTAGTGELTMGSDVFLNCFALEDLIIRATPEQATGLFALVGSITEAVRALFWPVGRPHPGRGCGIPPTGRTSRRRPPTSCSTPFRGRATTTGSAFSKISFSRRSTTPSSRRATTPTTLP